MRGIIASLILITTLRVPSGQEPSELLKIPVWPADGKLTGDLQGQYVFRDAATDELVLSIPADREKASSPRTVYRYRPQNQVEPQITVEISRTPDGRIIYRYVMANGGKAKQAIDVWTLVVPAGDTHLEIEHPKWLKHLLTGVKLPQAAHAAAPPGDAAYWSRSMANGQQPSIAA